MLASENLCCVRRVGVRLLVVREFGVGGLVLCDGSVWGFRSGLPKRFVVYSMSLKHVPFKYTIHE